MMLTDPEALNRRLADHPFLQSEADRNFYADLVNRISSMEQPGDDLAIPHANEQFAWRRAYALYTKLLRRHNEPNPTAQAEAQRYASLERDWNDYLADRGRFLELVRQGVMTEDAAQYLGMKGGDMDSPTVPVDVNNRYGGSRHPYWEERAERLRNALARWRDLPQSERESIPIVMKARRANAASQELRRLVMELTERVAKLEAAAAPPISRDTAA